MWVVKALNLKRKKKEDNFVPSFNDVKMNQYNCRTCKERELYMEIVNVFYFSVQEMTDLTQTVLHYHI